MKIKIILFLFFLILSHTSYAQKLLEGRIVDYFTNQCVEDSGMEVLLLNQDSVRVDTGYVSVRTDQKTNKKVSLYSCAIPKEGDYILKCSHPNYKTEYLPIHIIFYKREAYIRGKDIRMKRVLKEGGELGEVEVKATKLKFYFRNDTLVYNADAFNTQYGFVLNDILKKMPGITIEDGYEIYSNGRKVDELLLNGKDFFNSDRETLMENLPAYMIKNVRIYEHDDTTKQRLRNTDRLPLAMDVKLKVEYHSMALGSIDMGGGTDQRYFGRILGMRIHDLFRWTAFAGSNNINRNEAADKNGQLYNMDNGTGDKKFHVAAFNYNAEERNNLYRIDGKFRLQGGSEKSRARLVEQYFFDDGDIYSFTSSNKDTRDFSVQTSHTLDFFPTKPYSLQLSPSFVYVHTKTKGNNAQFSANKNISEDFGANWVDSIRAKSLSQRLLMYGISRTVSEQMLPKDITQLSMTALQNYRIPHTEDVLSLKLSGAYSNQSNEMFNRFKIDHLSSTPEVSSMKNLYQDYSSKMWQWGFNPSYILNFNTYNSVTLDVKYQHNRITVDNLFYDLATIDGWGADTESELGQLPSQTLLMDALNATNSHGYTENDDFWTLKLSYAWSYNARQLSVSLPMKFQKKSMDFRQENNNQKVVKDMHAPDFELKFMKWATSISKYSYVFEAKVANSMPELFNFVSQRTDIYDMMVTQGNPNLKNQRLYSVKGTFTWNPKPMHNHSISCNYYYIKNQVATAILFDKSSGRYTYTPTNISGNQRLSTGLTNSLYLDRQFKHKLSNRISYDYIKSADYSGTNLSEVAEKSIVHNSIISEKMEYAFSSRNTKYRGSVAPYINYQRSSSRRKDFTDINAYEFGVTASANIELPWSVRFNTEIKSMSRRGYNDDEMNDNEVLWNMGVVKSFKNNVTISLNAVDLLRQRKNYYRMVTAQATVERVSNMLRRYVMLHIVWNFSKKK